jgi:hypothetical protein
MQSPSHMPSTPSQPASPGQASGSKVDSPQSNACSQKDYNMQLCDKEIV